MGENADRLKQAYEDFNSGNMEAVLEFWHDDIRWEGSSSDRVPGNGTHEGKEAITQSLGEFASAYDSVSVTPDEFIEDGDTVVALGHTEASKGDRSEKVPFVHIWRFEGGKVKRVQLLTDTAVAAELAEG